MALKHKTHDNDKASFVQRIARTSNDKRPLNPAIDLKRATSASPAALRPSDILVLQRAIGNRAVQRLLDGPIQKTHPSASSAGPIIQAKLTIGPAGDKYEQEADCVARQIMSMDAQPAGPSIQRIKEDEEELQKQPAFSITPLVQRQASAADEELQTSSLQREESAESITAEPAIEAAIQQARGGRQSLPATLRARMERALGADFSGVRVHTDSAADALNRSLQARAFTNDQDLFFKQGEYNPASHTGQELIAHELTHVIQQGGGRAQPSAGNPVAPLHSRIRSSISSGIQSTQAQLQMKKSYGVLKIHPKGPQSLAVYQKVGYHITIGDPEKTYTFEEFHVTFENNTVGRQAHLFYDDDANYKQVPLDKEHEQTKLYRADVNKYKLKTVDELKTEAKTYATAFVTEINEKQAAEQKRIEDAKKQAEEDKKKAEEDAIKDVMTKASIGNHNGFKLVTKAYFGAEGKDNNEKRIKAKFPEETVKATLGPPAKVVWGSKQPPTNQIIIEVKLKDFKKDGEIAYRQLRTEGDFFVTTAALN